MKFHATLAAAATALSAQTALADPIPVYTGSFLTGVIGLETSIGAFNVAWEYETCQDAYSSSACTFSQNTGFDFNKTEALAVTKSLNSFMSTQDKTLLPGYVNNNVKSFIVIPYAVIQQKGSGFFANRVVGDFALAYATNSRGDNSDAIDERDLAFQVSSTITPSRTYLNHWATFTPYTAPTSAVPEPSSWLLMALGLGALGMASRKRPSNLNPARLT